MFYSILAKQSKENKVTIKNIKRNKETRLSKHPCTLFGQWEWLSILS